MLLVEGHLSILLTGLVDLNCSGRVTCKTVKGVCPCSLIGFAVACVYI